MCSIFVYERNQKLLNKQASSGCGIPLSSNSKEEALKSFGLTLNGIYSWLKLFKTNYEIQTKTFCEEILDLFQKRTVTLPKHVEYINKRQMLLIDIGVKWFRGGGGQKPAN